MTDKAPEVEVATLDLAKALHGADRVQIHRLNALSEYDTHSIPGPDARAALARLLAEARAEGAREERERCAALAYEHGCGFQELRSMALSSSRPEDCALHLQSEHAAFGIAAAIRSDQ